VKKKAYPNIQGNPSSYGVTPGTPAQATPETGHREGFTSRQTSTLASHFPKAKGLAGHSRRADSGGGGGGDGGGGVQGQHSGQGVGRLKQALRSYLRSQSQPSGGSQSGQDSDTDDTDDSDTTPDNQQTTNQAPDQDVDYTEAMTPEEIAEEGLEGLL
jgi:hypothetical protein